MIPAREAVAGQAAMASEVAARFSPLLRDPQPFLHWARRQEELFACLAGLIRSRAGSRVIGVSRAGGGIGKSTFARELVALLRGADYRVIRLGDYLIPRLERDARGI